MSERVVLTAVYEPDEDGWVRAHLVEWPAVVTCGQDLEEARAMLRQCLPRDGPVGEQAPVDDDALREPLELTIA